LLAQIAPHRGSDLVDPRFRIGLSDLAVAARALEGLRARGFAAEWVGEVLGQLEEVVQAAEDELTAAVEAIEALRPRRGRPAKPARSRGDGRGA
jgi:hypothetical protein